MIFTSKKRRVDDIDLSICNTSIQRVHVTKFLGVQIDSKLSWVNHIEYTCKKLSKCVAILAKARKQVTKVMPFEFILLLCLSLLHLLQSGMGK